MNWDLVPTGFKLTAKYGIQKRLDNAKFNIEYYNDPKNPSELKHSLSYIISELDEIKDTLDYMHKSLYYNSLEPYYERLNQLKETIQMMISIEVS